MVTFWSIYCPVLAALVSAFVITELVHVVIGYYVHQKTERLRQEFEAKVASGEIDPMQMMFGSGLAGGLHGPMMVDIPPLPTASGGNGKDFPHGQYL